MNKPTYESEEHGFTCRSLRLRYLFHGHEADTLTATRHVYNKEDEKQILADT